MVLSVLPVCPFFCPVIVSLGNTMFNINIVVREAILLQKKKIIGCILKLNVNWHKLYLGRGISVREWGGQQIWEYLEVVLFQITHISHFPPIWEFLLWWATWWQLCGSNWYWLGSSSSNSSSSSSRCTGVEQRLRTDTLKNSSLPWNTVFCLFTPALK